MSEFSTPAEVMKVGIDPIATTSPQIPTPFEDAAYHAEFVAIVESAEFNNKRWCQFLLKYYKHNDKVHAERIFYRTRPIATVAELRSWVADFIGENAANKLPGEEKEELVDQIMICELGVFLTLRQSKERQLDEPLLGYFLNQAANLTLGSGKSRDLCELVDRVIMTEACGKTDDLFGQKRFLVEHKEFSGDFGFSWGFGCTVKEQKDRRDEIAQTVKNMLHKRDELEFWHPRYADSELEARDVRDVTALQIVCAAGHVDATRVLLENGALVNYEHYSGESPLMLAAGKGCAPVVKLLLEKGANANLADNEMLMTPLMFGAQSGQADVIKEFVNNKVQLETRGSNGVTALHIACAEGHVAAAQVLLDGGAKTDPQDDSGNTPLMVAAGRGHSPVVKVLLETGANVNLANNALDPPLLIIAT
ncbi:hypothetical protein PHYBOEH_003328 [Phytophthora boehmeriae]|uniref:Ankyrin repeat protein n=1 Tax=Phytophthora boehmeriae TaxID=109152 RepID=A0A8T1WV44_9STRA|nr:hypothetical protein PHYBOEH_003328 [Phytophthora boehmeriae]